MAWTPRHEELRAALLSSKALEPLERSGSDTEALDFVRHVVIEVEKRVDHGLLGKPLATEVDWKEWVRHIAWLAAQDGRHVGCAVRFLKLKDAADLAGSSDQRGSGVDSDDLVEASESVINDVLNEEENKGDVWYDCDEQELTSGQLSLKVALFASGALGEPGEWLPAELNDFVDWVVRQVERRLDSEHPATRTLSGNVSWEWWVEHLARLALHRSIHVTAANKHLESLPPPLTYASDSDSDDDGDVFEIDGSIEVEGPRAGKSRERREAEAMTGPVTIPVVDESADAQAHLRNGLAMGANRAIHVVTDQAIQPLTASRTLLKLIEKEQPDLVILGKQAIDDDANQTGQMLATLWGRPQATFASKLEIADGKATVTREVDAGLETLEVDLPAVVTTDLRLNEPRFIKLPDIMKAKAKPLETLQLADLGVEAADTFKTTHYAAPSKRSKGVMVKDAAELVAALKQKGLL